LQKAAMRTAAVVVSFVLISFTVSAQDFWKKLLTNSTFSEIALSMVETSNLERLPQHSGAETIDWLNFDKAFDPELELEGWMTNESYFKFDTFQTGHDEDFIPDISIESTEESLTIESWMTSADFWRM
jgi:hypothetical protein